MKYSMSTRLVSLLLTLTLVLGCCPVSFATQADDATEPTAIAEETMPTEATEEPTEETEETTVPTEPPAEEVTEPTEEATQPTEEVTAPTEEATDPTEEATDPTEEATEPTEETTEPTEETTEPTEEAQELPFGLKGLPEDYVLSKEALLEKQSLLDYDVCGTLAGMTPGIDYEEDIILVTADTEEEAQIYADAFQAELVEFHTFFAVLRLNGASVPDVVAASADARIPLPAASPNYIERLKPVIVDPSSQDQDNISLFSVPQKQSWDSWVNTVMKNPDPFLMNPSDSDYQYMHDVVDSYSAWGVTTGKSDVIVAVVDSGVNGSHPDLQGKVVGNIYMTSPSDSILSSSKDENGHGTHVAGIIAATMDNGQGGSGLAPNVRILNVRVLDAKGSGNTARTAAGIRAAVNHRSKVRVINLSLGGHYYTTVQAAAIKYALDHDISVVAAMGNDGSNTLCYPAGYNYPGLITVGATDRANNRAYFSNYGSWQDVSAPGYNILSTSRTGGYEYMSGTSQATPVVSGIVALYRSMYPNATAKQVEKRLKDTATKAGSNLGAGIVNAAKMLSQKPSAPIFYVRLEPDVNAKPIADSSSYRSEKLPCESCLTFDIKGNRDDNEFIVYTLDGTTPALKNGEISNGTQLPAGGFISLANYAGKTITVKAIQVNGMGMASSVLTKKINIAYGPTVSSVTISGPEKVAAGKTATFTAQVEPANKASQSVTWSIVSRSKKMSKATISSSGTLTVPSLSASITDPQWVWIQAASKTNPEVKSVPRKVSVERITPISSLKLSQSTMSLLTGQGSSLTASAFDSKKHSMPLPELTWVSSNTKVATVTADGTVTAVGYGTATIACKAQDGSKKSAKCSVTVKDPVNRITISGQSSIAPGDSARYSATVLPATSSKTVTWSLVSAPAGVTLNTSKRIVTVPETVTSGTIKLRATATDGTGVYAEKIIPIATKCTSVFFTHPEEDEHINAPGIIKRDKYGNLSIYGLYNVDLPDTMLEEENILHLDYGAVGKRPNVVWFSSKPDVASVDQNGLVTAHKPGKTTISITAQDGSKEKAELTLQVTVPPSSLSIRSSLPEQMSYDFYNYEIYNHYYLGTGRSATHKVTFADPYGKPTNQKVNWELDIYRVRNGKYELATDFNLKWVKLDRNGTLTLSNSQELKKYWEKFDGNLVLSVTARSVEREEISDTIEYVVVNGNAKFVPRRTSYNLHCQEEGAVHFTYKQRFFIGGGERIFPYYVYGSDINCGFTATSSDPKIVSVTDFEAILGPLGEVNEGYYQLLYVTGTKKGTATITVKATDGSGASCTFKIKVK